MLTVVRIGAQFSCSNYVYSDLLRARSDDRVSNPSVGWEIFSSSLCPYRLWCTPSLLSNEYRGLFPCSKRPVREADRSLPSSAAVKECVELYLHSPNTSSWRLAWLSTGTILLYILNKISIYMFGAVRGLFVHLV
jgi:hypothetical protein